nr:uncharacterized protein LOC117277270 [Nicotiana tomentosiformis]
MRLDILVPNKVLVCVVSRSFLFERIKACQYDDPYLFVLKDLVYHGDAKEVNNGDNGVLILHGRICVPNMDDLRDLIPKEAHSLRYSIHPGVEKYEHQRPCGLLQRLDIPEWNWERIMIYFVVGHPRTLRRFDAVWVIMDRPTKSEHFIPKYYEYPSHVLDFSTVQVDGDLTYDVGPVAIFDWQVSKLRSKNTSSMKAYLRGHTVEEDTWETKKEIADILTFLRLHV